MNIASKLTGLAVLILFFMIGMMASGPVAPTLYADTELPKHIQHSQPNAITCSVNSSVNNADLALDIPFNPAICQQEYV